VPSQHVFYHLEWQGATDTSNSQHLLKVANSHPAAFCLFCKLVYVRFTLVTSRFFGQLECVACIRLSTFVVFDIVISVISV
jgi:hypothetical protein